MNGNFEQEGGTKIADSELIENDLTNKKSQKNRTN